MNAGTALDGRIAPRMTLPAAGALVVPGPTSWVPGAAFMKFRRDPLAFFTETQRTYGDVARFAFGPQQFFLVSHPDWIEDVLVTSAKKFHKGVALQRAKRLLGEGLLTSEGQAHLRQRRTIQPLFHRQQVQRFAAAMITHAARWRDSLTSGATINVTHQMGALTLAIVGDTLFSSNVQADTDEVRDALSDAVQSFGAAFLPGIEFLEKLPLPVFTRVRHARERLDRIILKVIAERRVDADERPSDLVSMLLAARDPENPAAPGMSDQQIRDEAMTIFLAGHETTANAMAWTWYLLGLHPAAEAKLHAELDRALGGRIPTVEDLPRLEYTRAIVAESMRLYPPAWTMGRKAIEEHAIGGYSIPAGALVIVSQWVVHRDPRWWPNAEGFEPERWMESANRTRPRYAYFPFGGGARICIGESFAWTEAMLLLATIAQQWRFVAGNAPTPEPRITLRPKDLFMQAVRR
jgi:cytochrome P450